MPDTLQTSRTPRFLWSPVVEQIFSPDCATLMDEQKIRPLTAQELQANVSGFLDLRPDRYALHHLSKHLAILEFTRAMDSSEDWEEKKDAEKRS
jgi:hypothetical protein